MDASSPPAAELARAFGLPGRFVSAEALRRGHIHETWILACEAPAGRFLAQRLNTRVFRDPEAVMENLVRVTDHLRRRLGAEGASDLDRRVLRVLATPDGATLVPDGLDSLWRCFPFIEETVSLEAPANAAQAHGAARAFGAFAAALADMDPKPVDTIPYFHDFARRRAALEAAAAADVAGRAGEVARDLEAAASLCDTILARHDLTGLPLRVVHNDCKFNNLLFDAKTRAPVCVVDLDTVMCGSVVYDLGELVRSGASRAREDEVQLDSIRVETDLLEALAAGYQEGAREILTPEEIAALPLAGARLALEDGIRFLTDHLEGDVYYGARRPGQNLDRHRAHRRLTELLLEIA